MKTTIDIADSLLARATQVADAERTTIRALIEEGLRRVVDERDSRPAFRLRKASFGGRGLHPDVREGSWDRIRELTYDGRGA